MNNQTIEKYVRNNNIITLAIAFYLKLAVKINQNEIPND